MWDLDGGDAVLVGGATWAARWSGGTRTPTRCGAGSKVDELGAFAGGPAVVEYVSKDGGATFETGIVHDVA